MESRIDWSIKRRRLLQAAAAAGSMFALQSARLFGAEATSLIRKPIPANGEMLPVIGIGTNAFQNDAYADLREVLTRMQALGGTVIDTAASYGESEAVIGRALAELGLADKMFISTKFNAAGLGWGPGDSVTDMASVERSLARLRVPRIDLLEVHRLQGLDALMPMMQELKRTGKIRYLGVTTFRNNEHDQMVAAIKKYPLDFIQIDYSLANRQAAERVFPIAQERKIAVMINVPLGGRRGSLFQEVGARTLPAWAAEFQVASWSQFFLKYVVSHPAVTCVIPGSTRLSHLEDNQAAGRGRLPDARERLLMEQFWDAK